MGLVLEGKLTLELGFERFALGPGDTIVFSSPTPRPFPRRELLEGAKV